MNDTTLSASKRFALESAELATAVGIARGAIAKGGTADLELLAERLTALLDGLEATPEKAKPAHVQLLLALFEEVEALGNTVADEHRRCSAAIARGDANHRAIAAYTSRNSR